MLLRGTTTAAVAAVSLVIGGLAAGLGRLVGGTAGKAGPSSLPSAAGPVPTATARPSSSSGPKPGKVPSGTAIGPAANVPVGQAASFQDPATGDPSIVIQPHSGQFLAFDAVCPHAGCTVGYDPTAKVIVCPCHGSQFNASTGAVEVGPAATGLKRLAIAEGSDGQLYDRSAERARAGSASSTWTIAVTKYACVAFRDSMRQSRVLGTGSRTMIVRPPALMLPSAQLVPPTWNKGMATTLTVLSSIA